MAILHFHGFGAYFCARHSLIGAHDKHFMVPYFPKWQLVAFCTKMPVVFPEEWSSNDQLNDLCWSKKGVSHVFRESEGRGLVKLSWGLRPQTPISFHVALPKLQGWIRPCPPGFLLLKIPGIVDFMYSTALLSFVIMALPQSSACCVSIFSVSCIIWWLIGEDCFHDL